MLLSSHVRGHILTGENVIEMIISIDSIGMKGLVENQTKGADGAIKRTLRK